MSLSIRLFSVQHSVEHRPCPLARAHALTLDETKLILDLKGHGRAPCHKVAELGEKHLRDVNVRLAQLRAFRNVLAKSVNEWRSKDRPGRVCAGEFCDLIERLP